MPAHITTTSDGGQDLGEVTRHLIHRPHSWDHCVLDTPCMGEEHFVLAGEMPWGHPLFNDGSGHFHDVQVATEAMQEAGDLIGQRYFGMPPECPGLFSWFALELTELTAWRAAVGRAQMVMRIRARPSRVKDGVPHGLVLRSEVDIDGMPCGTATASLAFIAPHFDEPGEQAPRKAVLVAVPAPAVLPVPPHQEQPAATAYRRADAAEVGRRDAANVVVAEPTESDRGRLSAYILTDGGHPVLSAEDDEHVPGILLIEALRQTSLLTAVRAYGLTPGRSTLAATRVHFRGYAHHGSPLRCNAVPGPLGRDTQGRPAVPLTLTVAQRGRFVAEATATVVQDF